MESERDEALADLRRANNELDNLEDKMKVREGEILTRIIKKTVNHTQYRYLTQPNVTFSRLRRKAAFKSDGDMKTK